MAKDFYADLDVHQNKILGLADGESPTDAVNRRQLDAASSGPRIVLAGAQPDPASADVWIELSN